MATKSFKDYYTEDTINPIPAKRKKVAELVAPLAIQEEPILEHVLVEARDNTTVDVVRAVIAEHKIETRALLESATIANSDIAKQVAILVESTHATNSKLLDAIVSLTDKVAMLEGKLDEIKNLEIPTPIVNLQMPSRKVVKKVHRDAKGIITHIEESEQFDDDNVEE